MEKEKIEGEETIETQNCHKAWFTVVFSSKCCWNRWSRRLEIKERRWHAWDWWKHKV